MQRIRFAMAMLAVIGLTVVVAACGSSGSPTTTKTATTAGKHQSRRTVYFYSSLPQSGSLTAQGRAINDGITLAVHMEWHNRAGDFKVVFVALNDATTGTGGIAANAARNARMAAVQPRTIFYIGDLSSTASAASIPVLNLADIPQVTPGSSYVGLTQAVQGVTSPGEPKDYYPSGRQTFLRILPSDAVEAAAQLMELQSLKCNRLAVGDDGSQAGVALSSLLRAGAKSYGISIAFVHDLKGATAAKYRDFAEAAKAHQAGCVVFAGDDTGGAATLADDVHTMIPTATIIGSQGVCRAAFTNPAHGGVDASTQPYVLCTQAALPVKKYSGDQRFIKLYEAKFHGSYPSPWALYGYVAAELGMHAVADLGAQGNNRSYVLQAMFARNHHSPIGTFSFYANGTSTLGTYGVYKVGSNGNPSLEATRTPTKIPGGSS